VYNGTAWVNAISSITTTGANTDAITVTASANGTVTIALNLADAKDVTQLAALLATQVLDVKSS
jgi:hypothetical protein